MRSTTSYFIAAALVLAACSAAPGPAPAYSPRPVVVVARWQVWQGTQVLGYVTKHEIHDASGPLPFYRIEDPQGRWLGHATASGRFSRRIPFADDEQDLGVWPMERGVAQLFEAKAPVQLRPLAVDAVHRRR